MTFEIVFVLALTLAAVVLFALNRLRPGQVAMAVPVVLLPSGILTPAEAVSGLSSRATVTVRSMLVLGLGLRKTGLGPPSTVPLVAASHHDSVRPCDVKTSTRSATSSPVRCRQHSAYRSTCARYRPTLS